MAPALYCHSHHKCASRWFLGYVEELSRLNGLSFYHSDYTKDVARVDADVVLFGNSSYELAFKYGLGGVHFVRNPLNLIVSAYFSHKKTHALGGWPELEKQRGLLEAVGLEEGLYLTISFLERSDINAGAIGPLFALRNWDYADANFSTLRVEDLVSDPQSTLKSLPQFAALEMPGPERFSFESLSGGRKLGEVDDNSHYRSGSPDEWKKYAFPALLLYVKTYFPALLARFYPEVVLHNVDITRPFYELDQTIRLALTYSAIARGGTVTSRWQALGVPEAQGWSARASTAASMLSDCDSVVDLGCGTMELEKYLGERTKYLPVDVVARDDRTVVMDFNIDALSVRGDGAASLGVVEYIIDVDRYLRSCRNNFPVLVVSYNCARQGFSQTERRAHAWVNDFSEDEIESIFKANGFTISEKFDVGGDQRLWKLSNCDALTIQRSHSLNT